MVVKRNRLLAMIGPGMLVAATGVGAGDLATGAFCGSLLGVAVLWAVVVGAGLKFVLNEGLMRWQLATGDTLLEGCVAHLGRPLQWFFVTYFLLWSFLVATALMSACGVTMHAILPLVDAPGDKIIYGVLHSAAAVALVKLGGYRLFEKVMSGCIAVMFVVVVVTAIALQPSWADVLSGLFVPRVPSAAGEGLQWTIALMGGIGGTVTVLCYGYWIREEGRRGAEDLRACRIDLAVAYIMTGVFGMSMIVIGSQIHVEGGGSTLIVNLADQLTTALGPAAKWAFLIGAWGAVFSSLLGVWQSVPYLFADLWNLMRDGSHRSIDRVVDTKSRPYQFYLFAIGVIPCLGLLLLDFRTTQKWNAILGAMFIPMLAVVLLILNGQSRLVGPGYRNTRLTTLVLLGALLFFLVAAWLEIKTALFG